MDSNGRSEDSASVHRVQVRVAMELRKRVSRAGSLGVCSLSESLIYARQP